MKRTATELRANLYSSLDHVARTGEVIEVTRAGVELCIVRKDSMASRGAPSAKAPRTLPGLIVGDPDALVHVDWEWNQGRDL